MCAYHGHVGMLRWLLAAGATRNAVNAAHCNAAHLAAARGHVGVLDLLQGEADAGDSDGRRAGDGDEHDGSNGVRNITCQEHHMGADDGDEDDGPAGVRNITCQEHHIAAEPGGGVGLSLTARDLSKWSVLHHAAFHGQVVLPTCDAPDL